MVYHPIFNKARKSLNQQREIRMLQPQQNNVKILHHQDYYSSGQEQGVQ